MVRPREVPEWFEARLPRADECSIGALLLERARTAAGQSFAHFDSGTHWTNGDAAREALTLARIFRELGVRRGDIVALWQPSGSNLVRALFACSLLGVTPCLINIAFRGNLLSHALKLSDAKLLYAHGELVERLEKVDAGAIETVLAREPFRLVRTDLAALADADLPRSDAEIVPEKINPWDIAAIIFTSGTTGPSKGVRVTACQLWSLGGAYYGYLKADDCMLMMLPLFHIAAMGALYGTMSAGASFSVMESFRPGDFWNVVRRTGVTTNVGSGTSLLSQLLKAPSGPEDRDHKLRLMLVTSRDPTVDAFCARFGCEVFAGYSMSETSVITISEPGPVKPRSVGRLRKGIQGRLVDEHDREVPRGQPGEMIIRSDLPWVLNDGYHNDPEATVKAWRNGWFHTGDIFIQDEDGDFFYLDRNKDVIRRRGENISSLELEAEMRAHPEVRDVAAVAAQTPDGEEVLAVVEPMRRETFDPAHFIHFLAERIPHFMVPRFVRMMDKLPRTETNKVQKPQLRAEGLTSDTWDREAAGLKVRRQKLTITH